MAKDARIYAKIGQRDQNNSRFSCHLLIFNVLLQNLKYFTPFFSRTFIGVWLCRIKTNKERSNAKILLAIVKNKYFQTNMGIVISGKQSAICMGAVYLRNNWEQMNKEHISRLTTFENILNTFSALFGLKAEWWS